MSSNINTVIIEGRASKEPNYQKTQNNKSVCRVSIANNRYFFSENEIKSGVCFFDVVSWGKLADKTAINLHKGSHILVEGELRVDNYLSKTGEKKQSMYILASDIKYLDKKSGRNIDKVASNQKVSGNIEEVLEVSF